MLGLRGLSVPPPLAGDDEVASCPCAPAMVVSASAPTVSSTDAVVLPGTIDSFCEEAKAVGVASSCGNDDMGEVPVGSAATLLLLLEVYMARARSRRLQCPTLKPAMSARLWRASSPRA